jgi:hypothetical protein
MRLQAIGLTVTPVRARSSVRGESMKKAATFVAALAEA